MRCENCVSVTNQKPGQWQWGLPCDISAELGTWGGIFDSQWRETNWKRWSRDLCVTSSWHPRDTWHVRDIMETEDITEEFSALVEWLQTFNLQSEVSRKTTQTIQHCSSPSLFGGSHTNSKDTHRTLFVWFYEATNNWNVRHKLVQIEKSRNSDPYFRLTRPRLVRFYGQFSMKMELPQAIRLLGPSHLAF